MDAPALPGMEPAPEPTTARGGPVCPACGTPGPLAPARTATGPRVCPRCDAAGTAALTLPEHDDDEHQDDAPGCPACGCPDTAGPGLACTACALDAMAAHYRDEDRGNYRDRRALAAAALDLDAAGTPDLHSLYGRAAHATAHPYPDAYGIDPDRHPLATDTMPPGAWRRALRACADELAARAGTTRPAPELRAAAGRPPHPEPEPAPPAGALF